MTVIRPARPVAAALLIALLGACTTPPPAATIAPNPNLVVQGIPPVPAALAERVARYTDFRGHAFVDWHPTRREMLVSHRGAGASTVQLYRIAGPMAEPEPLTDTPDPVREATYEPIDGRYIVFARASGGNEQYKLYRLDLPGKQVTLLDDAPERFSIEAWLHLSSRLLVTSVPLDRTAQGGSRGEITQTLSLVDPLRPAGAVKLAELPGGGWGVGGVSWDDRQVTLTRYLSANESQVWLLDLASRQLTQVLPAPGSSEKGVFLAGEYKRDGSGFFVVSDRGSEFQELMFYDPASRVLSSITHAVPWSASGTTVNRAGTLVAAQLNVDGRDELRLYDARTLQPVAVPALPPGSLRATRFHPTLPDLAFSLDSSQGPSQVWAIDPANGTPVQWTRASAPAGVDTRTFAGQDIVRWKSFDGRGISGILTRPPARFTGQAPGADGASTAVLKASRPRAFIGRANYFVNELGIALIEPNVRGSDRLRQDLPGPRRRLQARRLGA